MWRRPAGSPPSCSITEFRTPEIEANLVKALLFSHQRFRRLIGRGYGVDLIPHIRLACGRPHLAGSTRCWPI